MSDLKSLHELTRIIEEWEQAEGTVETLLENLLPPLQSALPSVDGLRLYRALVQTVQPMQTLASTGDMGDAPALHDMLPDDTPVYTGQSWRVPIKSFGLLQIRMDAAYVEDDAHQYWLGLLGRELYPALYARFMTRRDVALDVEVYRSITMAQDYGDICKVILDAMPAQVTMTAIMLYNEHARPDFVPEYVITEAIATRQKVVNPGVLDYFAGKEAAMKEAIKRQFGGEPILVPDIRANENPVMPNALQAFLDNGAISLATIGLRSGNRLLGALISGSTENITLDPGQLMQIVAVADQAALTIENRNLIREAQSNLQESEALYEVNRALLHAESYLDVLRIIKKKVAPYASSIVLSTVKWDEALDEISAIEYSAIIDSEGEHEPRTNILDGMTPEQIKVQVDGWQNQKAQVEFFENLAEDKNERPALSYAYEGGLRSGVIMPVFSEDRLFQQISIGYDSPRPFDEATRRLYSAVGNQVTIVLQNQRLFRNTQEAAANLGNQLRVLQTINHLSGDLATTRSEKELTERVCEALVDALNIRHASIALYDAEQDRSVLVSEYPDMGRVGAELNLDSPVQAEVRRELRQVIVEDVETDSRLLPEQREMLRGLKIQSLILMPLLDERGRFIGSIGLDLFEGDAPFDSRMIDIASTILNQVTVSLQNIRLLESSREQAAQMEGIAGFSQSMQRTLDIDSLLETTILNTPQIIDTDDIHIMLTDNHTGALRRVAWKDADGKIHIDRLHGELVNLDGTTAGRAWETRSTLQVSDIVGEQNLRHTYRDDIQSVLTVPIYSRGVAIGLVEAGSTATDRFTGVDNAIFQQLISQLSIAIENAESYVQSQRLARSKALVNDISSQLQQQMEIEQLLDVTINELGKALGARKARIHLAMKESESAT